MTEGVHFEFGRWVSTPSTGEEVVISGMAGRFPQSHNVQEFADHLLNNRDLVSDDRKRWNIDHPEIPVRAGTIPDVASFDAGHFGVHHRQADIMDPMMRKFMEVAVEAVVDAGVHPRELEDTKTGVFLGCSWSDMETETLRGLSKSQNLAMTGYMKSLIAHRVSYCLRLKGPSFNLDTACSSSMNALSMAFMALRMGQCDSALVGGTQMTLHPGCTLQFFRMGVLSSDGTSKVFDQEADGYVRSEAINCVFLQRARNSRRTYAQVVCSKINTDGFTVNGVTFPSASAQAQLLKEIYHESGVAPDDLTYLEAHGTGTRVGDSEEVHAIDVAIARKRRRPLWIGSVKSNMGHSEPSSALNSVVKLIVAMETGCVAANLHLKRIKDGMDGLKEGRMRVVTQNLRIDDDDDAVVGVNNFGFGGNNCHVILRRFRTKKKDRTDDDAPRLVCVSGRTKDSVATLLDHVGRNHLDVEYIGLVHHVFSRNFDSHHYRGFAIVTKRGTEKTSCRMIQQEVSPPYVYFGKFEDSFRTLGKFLLEFPVFRATMLRINKVLSSKQINIVDVILRRKNKSGHDSLGAVAVQLGTVELLRSLDLNLPTIWGNLVGKLICAFCDQMVTLEQTVLAVMATWERNEDNPGQIFVKTNNHNSRYSRYFSDGELSNNHLPSICDKRVVLNLSDTPMINASFAEDSIKFLEVLGNLYLQGYTTQLHRLYPEIQFPVRRGTPMLSPAVKWDHAKSWQIRKGTSLGTAKQNKRLITLAEEENKYIEGHVIGGRTLFPATGYLSLVWEAFASDREMIPTNLPVVFENCKFIRATTVPASGFVYFIVTIQPGSGEFEIVENDVVVVTGRIRSPQDVKSHQSPPCLQQENVDLVLEEEDIYKELNLRGYNYSGLFKSLVKCNVEATSGVIEWKDNWVSFMDNMLQMQILQTDTRQLYVPVGIKKLIIDPSKHLALVGRSENFLLPIQMDRATKTITAGGIQIQGLRASAISKRKPLQEPVLERYEFVPNDAAMSAEQSVRVNLQIINENSTEHDVKALEIIDEFANPEAEYLLPLVSKALEDVPSLTPDLTISTNKCLEDIVGVKIAPITANSNFLLIIASKILQRPITLQETLSSLSKNGFLLSREDKEFRVGQLEEIEVVTQHTTPHEKLILLRKAQTSIAKHCVEVSSLDFAWLAPLQAAISSGANSIAYSRRSADGVLGLVNCIRREPGGDRVRCFFMSDESPKFDRDDPFYKKQIAKDLSMNVYKDAKWGTWRHLLLEDRFKDKGEHFVLKVTNRGDLSSLRWIEGPLTTTKDSIVQCYYSAINFKDIMTGSGRISAQEASRQLEYVEGFEYSGKNSKGQRVMGICSGCLSNLIDADRDFQWKVPNTWTLEDAVTVPVVYSTLLYGLVMRTSLKPGTSILIHSATGGVGLAAINVAVHHRCKIFVTVGNADKRKFLREHFPQIPESHIGNSHDTSFEDIIMRETKGRGVDVVLNSLAEEKLKASVRCLARGGALVEIGKFDMDNNNALKLALLEKEGSYCGVMLDTFFKETAEIKASVVRQVDEGIRSGYVKPISRTVFRRDQVETAFRHMTTGKHVGKVLVEMRSESEDEAAPPLKIVPRFYCDPEKVYIVAGGLGGFGLELVDWLVLRGARRLILTSRSGVQTGYQNQRIGLWQSYGTSVRVSSADVTSRDDCSRLIAEASQWGCVDGIFNLAMVLRDGLFEEQTEENFVEVMAPKAFATKHLDDVTRERCPALRHFVVFSSVSCGRGNDGQSNYGMANSVMERICEDRRKEGFAGLAIQWGAVGDVGLVAKMQKDGKELVIGGTLQQKISSCLDVLDKLLKQDHPVVSSMVVAEKHDRNRGSGSAVDTVATILGIKDIKTISQYSTLAELGMDSMMATEMIQILEKEFEIYITTKDVRSLTFSKLVELEEQKGTTAQNHNETKFDQGTSAILRLLPDSTMVETTVVRLPTSVAAPETASTVFVLPGVEGALKVLEPITKNLNAHAIGLQYNYKHPEESIYEIAQKLFPHVETVTEKSGTFRLLGYSFGVVVAIELASLLEEKGYVGQIIAIDGSPQHAITSMRSYAPGDTEDEFETSLLHNILAMFLPLEVLTRNKDDMLKCKNFDDRVDFAISLIPAELASTQNVERQTFVTLHKRFKAALNYRFKGNKVKSSTQLYKAKHTTGSLADHDYSLAEVCERVAVKEIEGSHMTIIEQDELLKDINKMLT